MQRKTSRQSKGKAPQESTIWKWGEPGDTYEDRIQYKSICRGGEVVTIGDAVLTHSDTSLSDYYIVRVLGFHNTDQQASATIEYVYWPDELEKYLKRVKKAANIPSFVANEVFLSNKRDTIELQEIAELTQIHILGEKDDCSDVPPYHLLARKRINLNKKIFESLVVDSINTPASLRGRGRPVSILPDRQPWPRGMFPPPSPLHHTPINSQTRMAEADSLCEVVSTFSPRSSKRTHTSNTPKQQPLKQSPPKHSPLKQSQNSSQYSSLLELVAQHKITTSMSSSRKPTKTSANNHTPELDSSTRSTSSRQLRLDCSDVIDQVVISDSEEEDVIQVVISDSEEEGCDVITEATPTLHEEYVFTENMKTKRQLVPDVPDTPFTAQDDTPTQPPTPTISSRTRTRSTKPHHSQPHTPQFNPRSTKPHHSQPHAPQSNPRSTKPHPPQSNHRMLPDDNILPKPKYQRKSARKSSKISLPSKAAVDTPLMPYKKKALTTRTNDIDSESSHSDMEVESDDEFMALQPLSRKRSSSAATPPSVKRPKTTPRPRTPVTPCLPERRRVGSKSKNHFEIAKERLHVSAVPDSLPCREDEFATILSFVEGKLRDGTGGCMYISGVPGTGKTATINEIATYLRGAAKEGEIPPFNFVEVNGLRLTDPHQAYVSILKQLTGQKATADHAANLLDNYFSCPPKASTTLLLADELDLLWTRKQTVLYNLFDWPSRRAARLIVLAVANTMDLPERIMKNKVASRLGLTRLTFQPYTFRQLQEIVTSRMSGLKVFQPDAIQLAARKVAAVSGDARRALDICRRATCQPRKGKSLVGMAQVETAVKEMYSAAKIQAIKNASFHERMFLRALVAELLRTGLEEALVKHVTRQLQALYRTEDMRPLGHTQLSLVCSNLCACRLLLVENKKCGRRIRLNISSDDVIFALRD